jgi:hypothetical protein
MTDLATPARSVLATWADPLGSAVAVVDPPAAQGQPAASAVSTTDQVFDGIWRTLQITGAALGAWHGYRRNGSVGWAVAWGLAGAAVPPITLPIAFAQGLGRPAPGTPRQLAAERRERLARRERRRAATRQHEDDEGDED